MTVMAAAQSTVFDALVASLQAAAQYDRNDQAAPAVVLWTDRDGQWRPLLPRLRLALPQLLTLGDYDPAAKTGPAIWLRPMIARTLPVVDWPDDIIPILYLPGVSRHHLRAVEDCPRALQPLAELQYRGVFWTQNNTNDWTVTAFLTSPHGGLSLDLARDGATTAALRNALPELADQPVVALQGNRLDADFLNELLITDPDREVLRWLNDPDGVRDLWDAARWVAFRNLADERYSFDPEQDGPLIGVERLGRQEGAWKFVWQRFIEAPQLYPTLPTLLRRAKPAAVQAALFRSPTWPQDNEEAEADLRMALQNLETGTPSACRQRLRTLESDHAERRTWVWSAIGQAPLANALEHLAALASFTEMPLVGSDPTSLAESYAAGGWRADAAALASLAAVDKPTDVAAVHAAVLSVYRPWLEETAERFQQAAQAQPLPRRPAGQSVPTAGSGTCVLFADGLRFDVGQTLKAALAAADLTVTDTWRFSTLPSVTPTAKPASSPIAPLFGPPGAAADFMPSVLTGDYAGKTLTIDIFRRLLQEHGYAVLHGDEIGTGTGVAWGEYGSLDKYGHDQGWRLAKRIDEEVRGLVARIQALLDAGWTTVRVVTDHGWLLLPGGLPKIELPAFLTESRWGRCATLRSNVQVAGTVVPWYWSDEVEMALPAGIACYKAGMAYAHGGLSPQECVVPVLTVTGAASTAPTIAFQSVQWRGLRCRVQLSPEAANLTLDLRTSTNDPTSSLVEAPKTITAKGEASLAVSDDSREGAAAVLVVLSGTGAVLAKYNTTVGED